jgi:hypothetical protein
MRFLPRALALATALAFVPVATFAQQAKGLGDYSIVGAEINTGKPVEDIQAGWPNVNFGYTFGLSKAMDMGFRFGFLYGVEGTTNTQFGLGAWVPLRFQLSRGDKFNLLFHVDPGMRVYFAHDNSNTLFAITAPVGLVMGFPVAPNLEIGGGLDFMMALNLTDPVTFVFTPWAGPYVEYHIPDSKVALGVNSRFGVAIPTTSGTSATFAFTAQAFVGYRLF